MNRNIGHIVLKGLFKSSHPTDKWKKLDSIDWDFKGADTQYLTHEYHSYPARFIPQIPRAFIETFTEKGDWVADTMCGCGTTLVEAALLGRNAIGYEFNPLACLITKVKTTPISADDLNRFMALVKRIRSALYRERGHVSLTDFIEGGVDTNIISSRALDILKNLQKPGRLIDKKFTPEIERKLAVIKAYLDTLEDVDLRQFAYVCFSSVIRTIVESKKRITDVYELFHRKARSMCNTMNEFRQRINPNVNIDVCYGDARSLAIASNSIDLIVMSPPYVNALDYYREHQYNMMWLGMDYSAFKQGEIGGHSHFIANRWRLLTEYLSDMFRAINEMKRILKKNGICVIVVGNSTIEYEVIESYKYFVEIGKRINFPVIRVYHRNIDITRKYTSKTIGNINEEYISVFEKPDDSWDPISRKVIVEFIIEQLEAMKDRIRKHPGTAVGRKKVPKERLLENLDRIDEAISMVNRDVRM